MFKMLLMHHNLDRRYFFKFTNNKIKSGYLNAFTMKDPFIIKTHPKYRELIKQLKE